MTRSSKTAPMRAMGDLTVKCAALNGLFVGLARAAGLSTRDACGLPVVRAGFGDKSVGGGGGDVTKAQLCRAEVWRSGFGCVPTDPADGRNVVLQEPRQTLTLTAAAALFGAWKGDWIAYTFDHAPLSFSLRP